MFYLQLLRYGINENAYGCYFSGFTDPSTAFANFLLVTLSLASLIKQMQNAIKIDAYSDISS